MGFNFKRLELEDLILVTHDRFPDERGFFEETYREKAFEEAGIPPFVQENHALSRLNVLRGLHYQLNPEAQGKLVRCSRGRVFDVAVDIRKGSRTFGTWLGLELSDANGSMLYIPEGFAHGYCALSQNAEIIYKTTGYWSPQHERAIRWNDPGIAIDWPVASPIVSDKDGKAPDLTEAEINFIYDPGSLTGNPR